MQIAKLTLAEITQLEQALQQNIAGTLTELFKQKYARNPRAKHYSVMLPFNDRTLNLMVGFDNGIRDVAQAIAGINMNDFGAFGAAVTPVEENNQRRQLNHLNRNLQAGDKIKIQLCETIGFPRNGDPCLVDLELNITDVNQIPQQFHYKLFGIGLFGL